MARITIHSLDDDIERELRVRAAQHGRSTEEEAREILSQAVGQPHAQGNRGEAIQRWFGASGVARLELPQRDARPEQVASRDAAEAVILGTLVEFVTKAEELLGSREEAVQWAITPALALEQRRPIDLLTSGTGTAMVRALLEQMEFGVYA